LGPDLADDSNTILGITGYSQNANEQIDLSIQVGGPVLSTGVYKSDDYFMPVFYIQSAPELRFYTQRDDGGSDDSKYSITITSITDKSISGHFTGNYLENTSEENDLVEITEGQFVAERVR
jgi:hypothetical protein